MRRRTQTASLGETPADERYHLSLRKAAEKFRRAREGAGLSLRDVAEKAGLAPSTILKIERSHMIPSMAVCIRLADALNRKISWFFEEGEATDDVRFIPRRRARVVEPRGGRIRTEVLAEPLVNPRMEGFLLTVEPGAGSGRDAPIVYRGEEIVIGVKGRLRFEIRGVEYVVRPGDTLHFKGDIQHGWRNRGPGQAQVLMVCAFGYDR